MPHNGILLFKNMAELRIYHDPKTNLETELIDLENRSVLTIGRYDVLADKQCDILLDYKHVSRRHCTLVLMLKDKGFFWTVKDGVLSLKTPKIRSANGTFINGNLINQITKLKDADTITFSPNHYYPYIRFFNEPTANISEHEKDTLGHEYEQ